MTLYLIGLGLNDEKDITVKGLETVKECDYIYLETYTSILQCSLKDLEKFYGKRITSADRDLVEKADEILEKAKNNSVVLLVVGDPVCATTHVDLILRAENRGIEVKTIHNSSIISAIGVIGLEVYKYGKTTSIPFHNEKITTPIDVFNNNQKIGLHTLFLLDLEPSTGKFLSIKEAASYLIKKGIDKDQLAVGCARIGSENQIIKVAPLKNIGKFDFGNPPYCLVLPGKLHFMEEDSLKLWQ